MSAEVSCITLMTLLSLRAPLLCTAVALTWIKVHRGAEIKRKPRLGAAKSHTKGHRITPLTLVDAKLCCRSRRWHLHLHEGRCSCVRANKSAPGCVHLCMSVVFIKGEGLSTFNYSTVQTLYVHSRVSHPTHTDTLLRGSYSRKETKGGAWYTHFMGTTTNQLKD